MTKIQKTRWKIRNDTFKTTTHPCYFGPPYLSLYYTHDVRFVPEKEYGVLVDTHCQSVKDSLIIEVSKDEHLLQASDSFSVDNLIFREILFYQNNFSG